MTQTNAQPQKDWVNIVFLSLTPIIGVAGTAAYTYFFGFEWWMLALLLVTYLMVGLSICAGYHRYFSHKSYECAAIIQYFYAICGAMAHQNSILAWASRHRAHHTHVDTDWDPYNIKRGFWWAHIVWVFYDSPYEKGRDLEKNKIVLWQHRWHNLLGLGFGFGIPLAVGALFGKPLAGLLWGGFLRVTVIHHTTFLVNSLSHTIGSQEFDPEGSARDNWLVAFLTLGEGYHSFHHRYPSDFRNGVRWYHWDPSKWFIASLKAAGLASNLRSTPPPLIEQARIAARLKAISERLEKVELTEREKIQRHLHAAAEYLKESLHLWQQHAAERQAGVSEMWRIKRRESQILAKQARREWRLALSALKKIPGAAA